MQDTSCKEYFVWNTCGQYPIQNGAVVSLDIAVNDHHYSLQGVVRRIKDKVVIEIEEDQDFEQWLSQSISY